RRDQRERRGGGLECLARQMNQRAVGGAGPVTQRRALRAGNRLANQAKGFVLQTIEPGQVHVRGPPDGAEKPPVNRRRLAPALAGINRLKWPTTRISLGISRSNTPPFRLTTLLCVFGAASCSPYARGSDLRPGLGPGAVDRRRAPGDRLPANRRGAATARVSAGLPVRRVGGCPARRGGRQPQPDESAGDAAPLLRRLGGVLRDSPRRRG